MRRTKLRGMRWGAKLDQQDEGDLYRLSDDLDCPPLTFAKTKQGMELRGDRFKEHGLVALLRQSMAGFEKQRSNTRARAWKWMRFSFIFLFVIDLYWFKRFLGHAPLLFSLITT
jgi:hypothetical protein